MRIRNLIVLSLLGVTLIVILAFVFAARPVNSNQDRLSQGRVMRGDGRQTRSMTSNSSAERIGFDR